MYVLSKKLQIIKASLKQWNKDIFGEIHDLVKSSMFTLEEIQEKIGVQGSINSLRIRKRFLSWTWKNLDNGRGFLV